MSLVTLDVVAVLPAGLREQAISCGRKLSELMAQCQHHSQFRLGEPFPGQESGGCEPHVSLFMLCVEDDEVPEVVETVARLAQSCEHSARAVNP